jgi:hypothetical protein
MAMQALPIATLIMNRREGANRLCFAPSSRSSNFSISTARAESSSPAWKNSVSKVSKWRFEPLWLELDTSGAGVPSLELQLI